MVFVQKKKLGDDFEIMMVIIMLRLFRCLFWLSG